MYLTETDDIGGVNKVIYQLNPDKSLEEILIQFPGGFDSTVNSRSKIRSEHIWISDNKQLFCQPLNAFSNQVWTSVRMPERLIYFLDFEIISDTEAMLCGASWEALDDAKSIPSRWDMHFVFNINTGVITTSIASITPTVIDLAANDDSFVFSLVKLMDSYTCRFDTKVLIVGKYSGKVTVYDTEKGSWREFQILTEEELPEDPKDAAINSGRAIAWIGPLEDEEEVLVCYRLMLVPSTDSSHLPLNQQVTEDLSLESPAEKPLLVMPRRVYSFCTLNLKTGKVRYEGSHYRGQEAKSHVTLFEENGQLLSVRDVIRNRTKLPETSKKTPEAQSRASSSGDSEPKITNVVSPQLVPMVAL
jgi:hypothetical protein